LNDLARADTAMTQPWATLRALGLYKSRQAKWGVDYVTSASMRIANGDNGFRTDELEEWIERGGFKFLPAWLEGKVNFRRREGWPEYLIRTRHLCEEFAKMVSLAGLGGYVAFFFLVSLFHGKKHGRMHRRRALLRVASMVVAAYAIFQWARRHVDQSCWAADIKAHRRYRSTVQYETQFADDVFGPSTFPTRDDVLIETRYGSKQLAMYNDFINGHPANRRFRKLVDQASAAYGDYPEDFQEATAHLIFNWIGLEHGRFLYQGNQGFWMWMDDEDALAHIKKELTIRSNKVVEGLAESIRFGLSDLKYGVLRDTGLALRHAYPYLQVSV
jgi:hypothetical protein